MHTYLCAFMPPRRTYCRIKVEKQTHSLATVNYDKLVKGNRFRKPGTLLLGSENTPLDLGPSNSKKKLILSATSSTFKRSSF